MRVIIAAFVCAWGAYSASAYSFKVKVDPRDPPEKKEVSLVVPKGAEAAERYFRLAEMSHPDLLAHGFAALPEQPKTMDAEDPLADLETNSVGDDAIQSVDKDVEYAVRRAKGGKSFVLMVVNRKSEDLSAEIELKHGKMREPVYRRVHRTADGKGWTTTAWQPPRAADLYPWTVEVPAMTVQTVTISVR